MRDLPSPRAPLIFLVFLGSRLSCCCLTNFSLPLVLLHVAAQFSPAELRCSIFAAAWPMDLFIHIGAHPYTSSFSFLSSAVRCSVPMPEPIACQWRLWFSTRLHLILVASLCAASLRVWSRFLSPGACLLVESLQCSQLRFCCRRWFHSLPLGSLKPSCFNLCAALFDSPLSYILDVVRQPVLFLSHRIKGLSFFRFVVIFRTRSQGVR
jgi:hypothetical protein